MAGHNVGLILSKLHVITMTVEAEITAGKVVIVEAH
jgi:hypothetical protein